MKISCLQLHLSLMLVGVAFATDGELDLRNLDSEQEYEILELDANIDAETGIRRYDDYQLLRIKPSTEEHIDVLRFLEKGDRIAIFLYHNKQKSRNCA